MPNISSYHDPKCSTRINRYGSLLVQLEKLTIQHQVDLPSPAIAPWQDDATSSFVVISQLILDLVGADWLRAAEARELAHPLVGQWEICSTALSRQGRITWKYEPKWLCSFMSMYFDAVCLLNSSGANEGARVLGDFPHFGSKSKEILARARARKPESYLNLQSELFVFGWAFASGSRIRPILGDGMPDFVVDCVQSGLRIAVEVKQPESVDYAALKRHIRKANSQVRAFGEGSAGLLIFDLRAAIGPQALLLHDGTNQLVLDCVATVRRILNGAYSAISAFIVVWDETFVRRKRGEETVLKTLTRRNSILTSNERAQVAIRVGDPLLEIGGVMSIEFQSDKLVPARVSFVRPEGATWLSYNAKGFECKIELGNSPLRQVLYR